MFDSEGKHRQTGEDVSDFQQAGILRESRTVSNVMRYLEESLLSIYIWEELLLKTNMES